MAQAHREEKIQEDPEDPETEVKERDGVPFKFNAQAPEFIPRSQTQMPISGYFYPCLHLLGGTTSGPDWIYVGDHEPPTYFLSNPSNAQQSNSSKNVLSDDLQLKIIKQPQAPWFIYEPVGYDDDVYMKQVEYQFSDMSLLANESLMKHISRDPEGYVPVSVIASTKKIKSLTNNHQMLVQALRSSLKLVVSNDGKKVRRKHPFTEKDKEELHSRIVVAENLPEDHSHQNLERIFSVVGSVKTIRVCHGDSVKTIRVCHPHESNSSRSKSDFFISNKLHALVEYETTDLADKAVEKLNDERNWRKGLRVRLLLRCSPKSVLKTRKSEFDGVLDDGETPVPGSPEDASQPSNIESVGESNTEENLVGPKKGWARGRGKARGRSQNHNGRGLLAPSPQLNSVNQCEASAKQCCKGPRMPDGTRGFTMGRGKPLSTPTLLATSPME